MRNEKEVLAQLLGFAENDMVRAVWLNGSRVNPNVTRDLFCDYDVVFAVTDPHHFLADQSWIAQFGDLIIMQQNSLVEDGINGHIFLMIFFDGIRIDLSFQPVADLENLIKDSLTVVLLDKDNAIGPVPPPTDTIYHTQKPTAAEFNGTTNEFWWCSTYVAKGLWRNELSYAKYMYEAVVRECMLKMLAWYIGEKNHWQINPGKYGKWFNQLLPAELWTSFEKTYAGADEDEMWEALFTAGSLIREIGLELATALGYQYPLKDDERVTDYLKKIRSLPKNAESM